MISASVSCSADAQMQPRAVLLAVICHATWAENHMIKSACNFRLHTLEAIGEGSSASVMRAQSMLVD